MSGKVAGYEPIGGIAETLMVFWTPPTVKLLTATAAPPFEAGTVRLESLMLKARIGVASVPAELETISWLAGLNEFRLMVLTPPPEMIVLATTVPPLTLRVPLIAPVPPLVWARRSVLFTMRTAPVLKRLLLLTLKVA